MPKVGDIVEVVDDCDFHNYKLGDCGVISRDWHDGFFEVVRFEQDFFGKWREQRQDLRLEHFVVVKESSYEMNVQQIR